MSPEQFFSEMADVLTEVTHAPYRRTAMSEEEMDTFADRMLMKIQSLKGGCDAELSGRQDSKS